MSKLEIITWPNKVLETKAKEVTVFDEALKTFVEDMFETMFHSRGIGLAANQVNDLRRIVVMYIPANFNEDEDENENENENGDGGDRDKEAEATQPEWWHNQKLVFINPKIKIKSGKTRCMEGCLSFPEVYEYVERAEFVEVTAQDITGKEFTVDAHGWFSICLQHEIDHLDGIVFINRMSRLKAALVKKKLKKNQLYHVN